MKNLHGTNVSVWSEQDVLQLGFFLVDSLNGESFVRLLLLLWGPWEEIMSIIYQDRTWISLFPPAPLYSSSDILLPLAPQESCRRICWNMRFFWYNGAWLGDTSTRAAKERLASRRDILADDSLDPQHGWRGGSGWPQEVEPLERHLTSARAPSEKYSLLKIFTPGKYSPQEGEPLEWHLTSATIGQTEPVSFNQLKI